MLASGASFPSFNCQDAPPSNPWACPGLAACSPAARFTGKRKRSDALLHTLSEARSPHEFPGPGTCLRQRPASISQVLSGAQPCARVSLPGAGGVVLTRPCLFSHSILVPSVGLGGTCFWRPLLGSVTSCRDRPLLLA